MDKGQGLPITTIVIAALALVVLVILFAITTGRLAIFTGAASECGGVCIVNAFPTGINAQPGILEKMGDPASRTTAACNTYEQKVQGGYIARGIRTLAPDNKPITCAACCIPTAY